MSLHHGLRSAAGASVADPYFASTSLLLLGNGTNGGQNNTFTDGSSNAFSVTRYGNTTQGTFSPFGYNWGVSFDGSGDYLTVPYSSNLQLGSSDFTIEFFIFFNSVASGQRIVSGDGNSSGTLNWCFYTDSTGTLNYFLSTSGTAWTVSGNLVGNISVGQWYHVALVRNGSTFTPYLNGVAGTTATTSSALYTTTTGITIGAINSGNYFNGNISNLRILKGTAQYTAAFTPPINNLTAITNTQLLTCQSNRFIDNSSNAFTITPYGDARVTNFAPFPTNSEYSTGVNGGSGYFDGSGDYLGVADNAALEVGSGDFTLETWVYYRGPNPANGANIVSKGNSSSFGPYAIGVNPTSGKVEALCSFTGSTWNITLTSSATLPTNTWTHLAFVRSGSTFTLYVNGTSNATTTSSSSLVDNTENLLVGKTNFTATEFPGYITDVRLVKGTAVYSGSSFTIPTAPLTAITNTSLLLNFTNASIIDSTGKNDIETVGDAQISTSTKKYGTGSLKFDGTGDYLTIPKSSLLDFGTGDFTIEAWINPTAASGTIIDTRAQDTLDAYIFNILGASGKLDFVYSSSRVTSSGAISTSVWTHVAVVRSSGTIKLYINGTEDGSASYSSAINAQAFASIGGGRSSASTSVNGYYFNGYIDDLRISKVARYTAAFTPPARQLPAR